MTSNYTPPVGSGGGAPSTGTYITESNESIPLPNSYQLVAGSGITLTPSANTLTVTATSGSGSVTDFTAGNLSPLFTTSVSNPTTTPALSFSLDNAAADTIFSNNTGGTAAPAFNTLSITAGTGLSGGGNVATSPTISLSIPVSIADGGTNATSASGAFNNLSPLTTLGDILYENSTPAGARLAGNTTSTKNFLTQTGTGVVSAAPSWGTIATSDLPSSVVTSTGNLSPLFTSSISAQALSFSLDNAGANTIFSNNTGSSGAPAFNTLLVSAGTGLTGGGNVTTSPTISVANSTANTLAGYNNSGVFSDVAIGTNLSLSSGTLSASFTGSGLVIGKDFFILGTVSNSTWVLQAYAPFGYTINEVYQIATGSGTATAAFYINGTPITGLSSISVTSSAQNVAATSANVVTTGNQLTLIISSVSSASNFQFTIAATRT